MNQNYSLQYIKMKSKSSYFVEPDNLEEANIIGDTLVSNKIFKNVTFEEEIQNISFDNCVFEGCKFLANLNKCVFFNVRFTKCDFSNIIILLSGIHSSLFITCNMIGTNICDSKIKKCELKDNNMRYAMMSSVTLDNTKLIENNMVDGRFDQVMISNIELVKNDFSRMEIIRTPMNGVDVTSSKIDELRISSDMVNGMIVNEVQAIELVSILGIIIK